MVIQGNRLRVRLYIVYLGILQTVREVIFNGQ